MAVVGGGNAALSAALSASEAGARVRIFERAPKAFRGGNSRHTRNMRCMNDAPTGFLTGAYTAEEYYSDLVEVTGGRTDAALARLVIGQSLDAAAWMRRHGVRFQPALEGTLHLGRTNAFFLGGGRALLNAYSREAWRRGIDVLYDADVVGLDASGGRVDGLTVLHDGRRFHVRPKAVVAASGGFEANLDWLEDVWGPAARNFKVRGTPYNDGGLLRLLIDNGAVPVGDASECHAVAVDARAPQFDGGIVTRLDCLPLGIVVNNRGRRFHDEGEDLWPKRYAVWGQLVARQPDQIAWSIIDSKVVGRFMPSVFPPVRADSIGELAGRLGLPVDALQDTVAGFNRSVVAGRFDHGALDDCRTQGLEPAKSHWAQALDRPPFFGYPLRPGITFTYLGVGVTDTARVRFTDGRPSPNIFAAGEIMAGNILGRGYLGGLGMTIGTVVGRIAGREAARAAA